MIVSEAGLVMLALFLLRLALPLIVTVIFGYGMNHLLDYWNTDTEL
jgi:hypothetical protein